MVAWKPLHRVRYGPELFIVKAPVEKSCIEYYQVLFLIRNVPVSSSIDGWWSSLHSCFWSEFAKRAKRIVIAHIQSTVWTSTHSENWAFLFVLLLILLAPPSVFDNPTGDSCLSLHFSFTLCFSLYSVAGWSSVTSQYLLCITKKKRRFEAAIDFHTKRTQRGEHERRLGIFVRAMQLCRSPPTRMQRVIFRSATCAAIAFYSYPWTGQIGVINRCSVRRTTWLNSFLKMGILRRSFLKYILCFHNLIS